ncbi:MAG: RnfABCDGE type electron transport complex subunit D [Candidatus Bathyarchaeota archaeon]|nr:RnfABCDGE type electron transport complex subunit D [Candidatus Bathyarchaeota archaeon]
MSKPKEFSSMTKDKLMTYTFIALLILAVVSYLSFGVESLILALVSVGVAVGIDILFSKVAVDSPLNIMSAAVFGLIVALCYTLGKPTMASVEVMPLIAPGSYIFVALISTIGMVLFKKIQGIGGRKFVNPAAAAKLVAMIPFLNTVLLPSDHMVTGNLQMPALAGPIGYDVIGGNGAFSFAGYLQACFASPTATTYSSVYDLMLVQKWHGWVGGISSIAVIIVGIALFVIARRYIKWRITVSYLATVALFALVLGFVYGDGDPLLRAIFHLFIGSSIFLAFFMATDPATTPLTYLGQGIFGVGLGILTVLIQTYMSFFGGSILALVIMNVLSPKLDKIGKLKPSTETKEPKLPKAKQFTSVKTYDCIRCGACMRVCCHKLSPILIKQAFDKQDVNTISKLSADYCTGCGHCTFVCPARIDLRASVLRAKAMLRGQ